MGTHAKDCLACNRLVYAVVVLLLLLLLGGGAKVCACTEQKGNT